MQTTEPVATYLEMLVPPPKPARPLRDELLVLQVRHPAVSYYRFLYDAVGRDYHWVDRKRLSDEQLAVVIGDARNELHVLYVEGSPAGFAELDRRKPKDIELAYFGLMPDFIGQGLGRWLLQWTADKAWSYRPRRLWVHTCTQDHPAALPLYKKVGFVEYDAPT